MSNIDEIESVRLCFFSVEREIDPLMTSVYFSARVLFFRRKELSLLNCLTLFSLLIVIKHFFQLHRIQILYIKIFFFVFSIIVFKFSWKIVKQWWIIYFPKVRFKFNWHRIYDLFQKYWKEKNWKIDFWFLIKKKRSFVKISKIHYEIGFHFTRQDKFRGFFVWTHLSQKLS